MHRPQPRAGVCISFDDRTVDQWFALRTLFKKYDAKATFFVTRFDSLTADQIEKLRILQRDGHEIGFHGALHVISEHYIKKHSLEKYIDDEIVAGIKAMNKAGFYPTSFSYPYSAKYRGMDKELLKYFEVLRNEAILTEDNPAAAIAKASYQFEGERLVYALAIDRNNGWDSVLAGEVIQRAVQNTSAVLLYGHEPERTFDVAALEYVLAKARENNLSFLRISDLVK